MIPDSRLRLKVNHKSNRVVLAADIHSVFDIAWYTLAKKVCEDAQPQIKQDLEQLDILEKPVLRLCPICGQAFVCKGKGSRRKYCGSQECNKRRVAQNVQNHRKKKKSPHYRQRERKPNKENRHRTRKALWHGAYFLISFSIL